MMNNFTPRAQQVLALRIGVDPGQLLGASNQIVIEGKSRAHASVSDMQYRINWPVTSPPAP